MKKFFAAWLVLAAVVGTVDGQDGVRFDVTPGFKISPARTADRDDADPHWFACHVSVDLGNATATGSGTPIAGEGGKTLVLTNAHVVPRKDAERPITVTVGGKAYRARYVDGSEVIDVGPTTIKVQGPDLCVLEVDAKLWYAEVAESAPAVGSAVYQCGFGGSSVARGPVTRTGVVLRNPLAVPTLNSTIPSVSGDSGSGVFNASGQLVGVCWGGTGTSSFAVEVSTVREFMGRPLLRKLFPRAAARADGRRAREAARDAAEALPPSPPAAKPESKNPAVVVGPVGSGLPPKPPGDGWVWDAKGQKWWKWSTPAYQAPQPATPGWFNISPPCKDGTCPLAVPKKVR